MTIKAIETVYNGYRFRSRLEARWAVFFDVLNVDYEYEKEGFDLDGKWYLPDFWMIYADDGFHGSFWLEIKATLPTREEIDLARRLAYMTKGGVFIATGLPGVNQIRLVNYNGFNGYQEVQFEYWADFPATTKTQSILSKPLVDKTIQLEDVEQAALAAKQARFEHGQIGAPSQWSKVY